MTDHAVDTRRRSDATRARSDPLFHVAGENKAKLSKARGSVDSRSRWYKLNKTFLLIDTSPSGTLYTCIVRT